MNTSTNPLVWIDVETTGLDPDYDQLLEVAMVITDSELEPIAGFDSVVHWTEFLGVNETVFKMHTDNGLFEDCRAGDGLSLTSTSYWRCSSFVMGLTATPLCAAAASISTGNS
jgi:oligoribonuclease